MRTYISGQITELGVEEAKAKFDKAEKALILLTAAAVVYGRVFMSGGRPQAMDEGSKGTKHKAGPWAGGERGGWRCPMWRRPGCCRWLRGWRPVWW